MKVPSAPRSMKILIADADLITRTLVERSLGQAGYEVRTVATPAEAELTLLAEADITTLILDGRPSAGFGPPLCQQIRQRLGERPLFVLMMCRREDGIEPRAAIEGGANDVIAKPVNLDELGARVMGGVRLIEAETGLWAARAYLAGVMDNLDVAVIITGPDGRVVQANEALARVGGVAPEDMIGRDRTRVSTNWQRHVDNEPMAGRHDIDLPGRQRRVLRVTKASLSLPWGQVCLELCQDASKEVLFDELMEKSASTDAVTGVLNHSGTEAALSRAWDRAKRHRESLSVASVRVHGLPPSHGPLGPAVAERVLRTLAQLFVRLTRSTDEVGRWLDDAFILVLHNAAPAQAEVVVRRLEKAFAALTFEGAPEVSISTGLAAREGEGDAPLEAVEKALRR